MAKIDCPECNRPLFYLETLPEKCKYCRRRLKPTKLALNLQKKIFDLTGIKVKPYIFKLYPNSSQRSAGAWLFSMIGEENEGLAIGSCSRAEDLGRAKTLWQLEIDVSQIEIGTNEVAKSI